MNGSRWNRFECSDDRAWFCFTATYGLQLLNPPSFSDFAEQVARLVAVEFGDRITFRLDLIERL